MNSGKCPGCGIAVSEVAMEHVNVKSGQAAFHGISYLCPSCRHVFGVSIDPLALKDQIVADVVERLVCELDTRRPNEKS